MKREMDELFVVYADDTGEPLEIFITNSAKICKEVFAELDKAYMEADENERDKLHPLNTGIFENTLMYKGVIARRVETLHRYYF